MSENSDTLPQLRSTTSRLVPPIQESGRLKRKLSVASSEGEEYEPKEEEESLVESVDDESSIQCEEDEKDEDEIDDLKKEGEIPLEELMVMYGLNSSGDYVKVKEESRDSGSESESTELERRMSMYDKDDWKKEISVGPEFQAEIPALLEKDKVNEEKEREEEKDTLLWRPDKLNSEDLNRYLSKVYSLDELPIADAHRDDEEALFILHSHGYKVENALERAEKQASSRNRCCVGQIMKPWSEDECQGFENGLKLYGKQFHLIQKNLVPNRTISEVVQFYYLWKKTERYDIFIQYYRLGSTRFIFNPGQPLDLDRSNYDVYSSQEGEEMVQAGVKEEAGLEHSASIEGGLDHPASVQIATKSEIDSDQGPSIRP